MQVKFEQFHDSLIPIVTPFGPMHMVPPWQKGDAVDLVLLFTAVCTMVRRVIPVEVMGRSGEIWGDLGRSREIHGDPGR